MKLSEIKVNPNNPQTFDDLSKLETSINEFPKMMELRPMVYDPETMYVLGGNKRLVCLQNLGYKEIPDTWIKSAQELTKEEKQRFIIADNVGFGEWDMELLEDWDKQDLEEWGLELPDQSVAKKIEQDIKPYKQSHILISFNPNDFVKIQGVIDELYSISEIEIEQSAN